MFINDKNPISSELKDLRSITVFKILIQSIKSHIKQHLPKYYILPMVQ